MSGARLRLCLLFLLGAPAPASSNDEACEPLAAGPLRSEVLGWLSREHARPPDRLQRCGRTLFSGFVRADWDPWRQGERFERSATGKCWLQRRSGVLEPYSCRVAEVVRDLRGPATFEIRAAMDDGTLASVLDAVEQAPELSTTDLVRVRYGPVENGGVWDVTRDGWLLEFAGASEVRIVGAPGWRPDPVARLRVVPGPQEAPPR
ncbi:MAG: hypothetical protein V2J24_14060 [Pseudomonadales bacterium]|nr:hypothetical protein [Pseudomonadales bacterium]